MAELDLTHFEKAIADVAEHEHPKYEDIFCLNLICWLGERAGLLVTEIKRLRDELDTARPVVEAARPWREAWKNGIDGPSVDIDRALIAAVDAWTDTQAQQQAAEDAKKLLTQAVPDVQV